MCQFNTLQDEDQFAHSTDFLEIHDTFKSNGVFEDAIYLRRCPFFHMRESYTMAQFIKAGGGLQSGLS